MMKRLPMLLALACLPMVAQAAMIGEVFGQPRIIGEIKTGDYEEVLADFKSGFAKGLKLRIRPSSSPFETMRIGLWLRERRPELRVGDACVGPCASFLLTSGGTVRVEPGTIIAFSAFPEWLATARDRIRAGELFIDGDQLSQAARARFLEGYKLPLNAASLMREATDSMIPAAALRFLRALTVPDKFEQLAFDADLANLKMSLTGGRCLWWIPDAEGLRQLGIDAPGYQAASRAAAAKLLSVDPASLYIGPMVEYEAGHGPCGSQ